MGYRCSTYKKISEVIRKSSHTGFYLFLKVMSCSLNIFTQDLMCHQVVILLTKFDSKPSNVEIGLMILFSKFDILSFE